MPFSYLSLSSTSSNNRGSIVPLSYFSLNSTSSNIGVLLCLLSYLSLSSTSSSIGVLLCLLSYLSLSSTSSNIGVLLCLCPISCSQPHFFQYRGSVVPLSYISLSSTSSSVGLLLCLCPIFLSAPFLPFQGFYCAFVLSFSQLHFFQCRDSIVPLSYLSLSSMSSNVGTLLCLCPIFLSAPFLPM